MDQRSQLFELANKYEHLTIVAKAKKPKVAKFKDGIIINGEFGSKEVDKLLGQYSLIIGDPPYSGIVSNDWDQGITSNDYIKWTKDSLKHLVPGGSLYLWGGIGKPGNRVFFEFLASVEKETGMTLRNLITWKKRRAYGKKDDYLFTREECAWLVNGDKPKTFNIPLLDQERGYKGFNKNYPAKSKFLRRTNVWTDINELFTGKVHIAQKPEKLAEIMIKTHTKKGDTIMDPFAGSGSSGLAARKLGRKFVLIERDPANFKIIVDRLKQHKTASIDDDYRDAMLLLGNGK